MSTMHQKNPATIHDQTFHRSVLQNEAVEYLAVVVDKWYIDATSGGGGHTKEIILRGGNVISIDQDQDAIEYLQFKFESVIKTGRLIVIKTNFLQLERIKSQTGIKKIDGILFDLGMSTHQIKQSGRGFSFLRDETLDMRMSDTGMTASDIVNNYSQNELYEIFRKLGEEQLARKYSESIVRSRAIKPITTTFELIEAMGLTGAGGRTHPATRVFQALRIKVNDELEILKQVLPKTQEVLDAGGRVVVIAFHSLEDRTVKTFIREQEHRGLVKNLTRRPIHPSDEEVAENRASRSAKLRAFEII